jgi:hypothetical protein
MLKVDPDERFDIDQVNMLCDTYKKHMANKPQMDTYLIMDDIIEKLSLLDYENAFCRGWKHKRISRIYWAHPPSDGAETDSERICMLYDMVYWLISLNKEQVSISFSFCFSNLMFVQIRPRNKVCSSTSRISKARSKMLSRK